MKRKRGALHSLTLLASQDGQTPLYWASRQGHLPIVEFLVERGANVDAATKVASHQSASY
jgi:ankyrin repeat protein